MTKSVARMAAKQIAQENGTSFGMSTFDRRWYTGSPEQLANIGVLNVETPKRPAPLSCEHCPGAGSGCIVCQPQEVQS